MTLDAKTAAQAFIRLYTKAEGYVASTLGLKPEDDRDTIINNLSFAERLFPQSGLMLCPRSHPGFKHMSASCEYILGHRHEHLLEMEITEFFSKIHNDDIVHVRQCYDFIGTCEPLSPDIHRYVINFRFRNQEGGYLHIRCEHAAIRTVTNNFLFLMLFTNVTDEEKFHRVGLDVYKNSKGNFAKIFDYHPRDTQSEITPRQHDIVRLIGKGFSNQEIADQLNVSVFTVKNHKRMLFKKVNVKNSIELLSASRLSFQ